MLKIVKIGGNIVDNPEKLDKFLADFAPINARKVLVHGGGKVATTVAKSLGIETNMIDGRRVTDAETLKVVTMVYAGLINKGIVSKLAALDCEAVGLCGADGNLITSKRRAAEPIDYGFVGDPVKVNISLAQLLLGQRYTIVGSSITSDGEGMLLNTNADTVARTFAVAMAQHERTELIYCFELPGVLRDINDPKSVIPVIDEDIFEELKAEGIISDGMLPKLENALKAVQQGVSRVVVCAAENLLEPDYGGTVIKSKNAKVPTVQNGTSY